MVKIFLTLVNKFLTMVNNLAPDSKTLENS